MSDKPNDQNDQNDDEKKDDSSVIASPQKDKADPTLNVSNSKRLLESKYFLQNSKLIFGYIDKIYKMDPQNFPSDKFNIYPYFLDLLHPGTALPDQAPTKPLIEKTISDILTSQATPENENTLWNGLKDKEVSGFLYVGIQFATSGTKFLRAKRFNKHMKDEGVYSDLENANICFSITTPRSLREYESIADTCRIVIHLSMSPNEFWKSEIALKLTETLQEFPFIFEFKVRDKSIFNKADSIIIYSTIDYKETWQKIGETVTQIIPESYRADYPLPFSALLEKGIVANIPIDVFVSGSPPIKTYSFTEGLAILGRLAYLLTLQKNTSDADDKLLDFQKILAEIFAINKLIVTEDGALRQPIRLRKN